MIRLDTVAISLLTAGVVLTGTIGHSPAFAEDLTVVSWGGSYTDSQKKAFFEPYEKESGKTLAIEDYSGGLAEVRAQVETGAIQWDVVDVELQDAVRGCEEGLFETLESDFLPDGNDGSKAVDDFLPGTLHDCGIGNIVWSNIVAYDINAFSGEKPKTIADFFDTKQFPGKRGMSKKPQVNLEWALIADGVPADQVYKVLGTKEGADRAFAKLSTLKDHTVFWEAGAQPPQLLADGEVTMSSAYNGRIYTAVVDEKQPFATIWDHQIWNLDLWVVLKGSTNLAQAKEFIASASRSDRMADQTNYISYGPARASAAKLIKAELQPHMPTASANFTNALAFDFEFWADHNDEMNERFASWLASN